jgi:hypothetical protein
MAINFYFFAISRDFYLILYLIFYFKDVTNTTSSLSGSSGSTGSSSNASNSPAQSPAPIGILHANPTEITLLDPEEQI